MLMVGVNIRSILLFKDFSRDKRYRANATGCWLKEHTDITHVGISFTTLKCLCFQIMRNGKKRQKQFWWIVHISIRHIRVYDCFLLILRIMLILSNLKKKQSNQDISRKLRVITVCFCICFWNVNSTRKRAWNKDLEKISYDISFTITVVLFCVPIAQIGRLL